MWLRLPNGRNELVVNEDHVTRLLAEGAVEIPDPRVPLEEVAAPEEQPEETPEAEESEQSDASASVDAPDNTGQDSARKSKRGKSAI